MKSQVVVESYTIGQADVLYVAQQISSDLAALSQAYPTLVSPIEALNLFKSYSTFLHNMAIKHLGFTISDPNAQNLVYHEYRYEVLYGGEVRSLNPNGQAMGTGGKPVNLMWLPASARFTPWLNWSDRMLRLSIYEQQQIVNGTQWDVPS